MCRACQRGCREDAAWNYSFMAVVGPTSTSMLVAVVLCFVVTELPQGVLAFLSGVDDRIFDGVYTPLGDVWDIVVLVNSSVNFLLYCTMSRQFRATFWDLFVVPLRLSLIHI